jgi:hypothetical protein
VFSKNKQIEGGRKKLKQMALLHTHTNIREDSGDWVMNITLPHDERLFPYHHQKFCIHYFLS